MQVHHTALPSPVTRDEALETLANEMNGFTATLTSLSDEAFWAVPTVEGRVRWSPAQNLHHLIRSSTITRLALRLPGFVLRWQWGTPNRPGRSYAELAKRYDEKLAQVRDGFANPFGPKVQPAPGVRARLMRQWRSEQEKFAQTAKGWREEDLDKYLVAHPLLGRLTLRELLYFTAYHTNHHHRLVRERSLK